MLHQGSALEDDSDGEEREEGYEDDDRSSKHPLRCSSDSELSISNESVDFDLVYALLPGPPPSLLVGSLAPPARFGPRNPKLVAPANRS
jgi:hypothetical protein